LLRGIVMPFTTGLTAAVAVLGVLGTLPALGASARAAGTSVRSQEWWLASLHVTQAWPTSMGAGVTVAVLSTGVDPDEADLAGDVTTGPDFTGSGRAPGSPFWGFDGTAVATIIAGHGHGAGDRSGIIGIAPAARILSVRVTLEFNDPLSSDASISRHLPQAIADGITYAVAHGARIIDLPLDPGTLGLNGQGDPAAAGGSAAEQAAVEYALDKGVVLVAPAGDDGMGPGIVNYPAAYPGVIAVGAVTRRGQLASFSSRRPYVSLTAPGVGLEVPDLAGGYQMTSSTSAASGMVAGVAALILSRYPHLTVAQVTQAVTESTATGPSAAGLPPLPARSTAGAGYGTVDAARAVQMAALITAASQPAARPTHPARPRAPARRPVAAPPRPGASALARSVLLAALAGVCVLIVLLVVTLMVMRPRRERGRGAPGGRARARGLHEHRRPEGAPAAPAPDQGHGVRSLPQLTRPGPLPPADTWPSPGGWQGGGIGEIDRSASPFRPALTSAPRVVPGHRSSRGAGADGQAGGPPWAPAPQPGRTVGLLPVASPSSPPPEPGAGIRVPGDMAVPTTWIGEPAPPAGADAPAPPADLLATPLPSDFGPPRATAFPSRENLGFAAAPVAADYPASFPAEPATASGPVTAAAADPSYIWDLAATDVFPATAAGTSPAGAGTPAEPANGSAAPDAPPPPEGTSGGGGN
jgi:Subtilase family